MIRAWSVRACSFRIKGPDRCLHRATFQLARRRRPWLGPLIGALVWVFLDAFVSGFSVHWPLIIGLLVFLIVFFMPGGLMGLVSSYTSVPGSMAEEEKR